MATVYKPLNTNRQDRFATKIFLAGSIEMGSAIDWQDQVANLLQDITVDIYNPRRDSWDNSWKQSIENENFKNQVTWELDHLDASDIILFYFAPETKSPISLLELGHYINTDKKLFVVCPEGFWRKGNIEIMCDRYNITLYKDLLTAVQDLKQFLKTYRKEQSSTFYSFKNYVNQF